MKSPGQNKRNRSIVAVDLNTGIVYRFKSLIEAQKATDTSTVTIYRCAEKVKPGNGYVWANPDDERRAMELATYIRKNGIQSPQRGRRKKPDGMVWLQIDSHTRIRVRPEEATPEFAIKYTKRLNRANRE